MLGNALFADGSGAVVLGATDTNGKREARRWRLAATGSYVFPNTSNAMTWNIGDHGFEMAISTELPRLIAENLDVWLSQWLKQHGLRVDEIRLWAIHPGGPRIIEAVESAMKLTSGQTAISRQVLSKHGNMSSATVLFILQSMFYDDIGPPCVMLGFGPGLVAEVALFT